MVCDVKRFCMEGPNKGKPGPCPEAKQGGPKTSADRVREEVDKRIGAGSAAKIEHGAKDFARGVKESVEGAKAAGLRKPDKTAAGRAKEALTRKPANGEKLTMASRVKEAAKEYAAQTLEDRKNDWIPVWQEASKFARGEKTMRQAGVIAGKVGAAMAGPYVRAFKLHEEEFGTPAAVAMSAVAGSSILVTKGLRAALAGAGVPTPGIIDQAVPSIVYGSAIATKWLYRNVPKIAKRVANWHDELPDWMMRYAEGDGVGVARKAKIIQAIRAQRDLIASAAGFKAPTMSDEQLWRMFVDEGRKGRQAAQKMAECPKKFCMEGPNRGKPGPCPGGKKSGPKSVGSQGRQAKASRSAIVPEKASPKSSLKPTSASPGSDEGVREMAKRHAKGQPLFHPDDGKKVSPGAVRPGAKKAANAAPKNTSVSAGSVVDLYNRAGKPETSVAEINRTFDALASQKLPGASLRKIAEKMGIRAKHPVGKLVNVMRRVALDRKGMAIRLEV